jgi:hypothetical protein
MALPDPNIGRLVAPSIRRASTFFTLVKLHCPTCLGSPCASADVVTINAIAKKIQLRLMLLLSPWPGRGFDSIRKRSNVRLRPSSG